jgi:hypothetical protein
VAVTVTIGAFEVPTTEAELQAMLDHGELTERNALDVKRELASGAPANAELANDLASFAAEGGLYIIGVAERPVPGLTPQPLAGVRERIGNVGLNSVRPALRIDVREFFAAGSTTHGYLVVIVPRSPDAPHEANHKFWGRSAAGKVPLRHEEIERLRAARQAVRRGIEDALAEAIANDPTPPELRQGGHLFVVARPVAGIPRMLRTSVAGGWERWIKGTMVNGAMEPSGRWWPDIPQLYFAEPRPRGMALYGVGFLSGRRVAPTAAERELLEVALTDDGEIRLFCGRAAEAGPRGEGWYLFEVIVSGLALRAAQVACVVADTCDFRGDWDFGLGVVGVRGAISGLVVANPLLYPAATPYPDDEYRSATRAAASELSAGPLAVVERLTEDLNAVLNRGSFRLTM